MRQCSATCFAILTCFFGGIALVLVALVISPLSHTAGMAPLLAGSVGLLAVLASAWLLGRHYIAPLLELKEWVFRMRGGELGSRLSEGGGREFSELAQDLNSLGEMLQSLSKDTELQLQTYTEHTNQKTRSLTILYDIAASINVARDLDDLLSRCLSTLTEAVDARAGAVRLLTRDGQMRLVTSVGLDDEIVERERVLPAQNCLCGEAVVKDGVMVQNDMAPCDRRVGRPFFSDGRHSMFVVPLQYRGQTLGVYNLYLAQSDAFLKPDMSELLTSIGRHLGMAIDKARLDEEANRLSIMEERTRIAHELHDSLAQTVASVRFQIRVFDETLHQGDEAIIWQQLERIETSIEEANTELRELIAHFRAPIDKRGLLPSIEQTVERFRNECPEIHVFLQEEWPDKPLPDEYEIQVLRVVQEALANVRKHGQANTVRVMLRGDNSGKYTVLVEDDGVGMREPARKESKGEHVGLSIMEDRARKIGGTLQIESEPGEGVRVVLSFSHTGVAADRIELFPRRNAENGTARTGYR